MNTIRKSDSIAMEIRKGFRDGNSKFASRVWYGYVVTPSSTLTVNPEETKVVRRIFTCYRESFSLGEIVSGLSKQG